MPLLTVNDLSVRFKTEEGITDAVTSLSFSIEKGEVLGIVGESGSGKSVSSLAILQLLDKKSIARLSGHITFNSETFGKTDLLTATGRNMRTIRGKEIAMIFQEPMTALNPVYRCGTQLLESITLHQRLSSKEAKQKAIALLEEVKLPEPERMFRSYPHEISGGQRQRVMIAMALAADPQLLIADEPTTALDVSVQAAVLDLLKQLQQKRGMSMIFISHDLSVVQQIADKVLVMYKGREIEQAPAAILFSQPQHPYTKALIHCRPGNNQPGHRLPVLTDFFNVLPDGQFEEKIPPALYPPYPAPPATTEDLVSIANLQVSYPSGSAFFSKTAAKPVLQGIDFTIRKGETMGLVGESGSGKTTLGRTLVQLVRMTGGTVQYNGAAIDLRSAAARKAFRKKVQIIFQDPYSSLNPRIKIGDAIVEVMSVHHLGKSSGDRKKRVLYLLEKVGLSAAHYNRYPHEFSGGQRQRISIARCLALEPEFIVCDESVAALDVSVQAQVLNLLKDLQAEFGLTYLFITHDLSVVRHIADRIIVLYKGEIAELQSAELLFSSPQSTYARQLVAVSKKD